MSKAKPQKAAANGNNGDSGDIKGMSKELQRTQELLKQTEKDLLHERNSMKDLRERFKQFSSESMDTIEYMQIEMKRIKVESDQIKSRNAELKKASDEEVQQLTRTMKTMESEYQGRLRDAETQITLLQAQLEQMSIFRDMQADMEKQVSQLKGTLETKEKEHAATASSLEHRFVQHKAQLKATLEQQVQDVITNFQKITEERVVKSSNGVLKENMQLREELSRANTKILALTDATTELKQQNKSLEEENQTLRILETKMAKRMHLLTASKPDYGLESPMPAVTTSNK